jgi:hypothetical protein
MLKASALPGRKAQQRIASCQLRVNMTGIAKSDERIKVRCKATKLNSESPQATTAHNLRPLVLFTRS